MMIHWHLTIEHYSTSVLSTFVVKIEQIHSFTNAPSTVFAVGYCRCLHFIPPPAYFLPFNFCCCLIFPMSFRHLFSISRISSKVAKLMLWMMMMIQSLFHPLFLTSNWLPMDIRHSNTTYTSCDVFPYHLRFIPNAPPWLLPQSGYRRPSFLVRWRASSSTRRRSVAGER